MKFRKDQNLEISVPVLRRLNKGDKEAFDEVYHACKESIYGKLLKLVKSEDIAREMLQKVFVRLWNKREGIDPNQPVIAWLHRVAANMVVDYFRKAARDRKLEAHLTTVAEKGYSHVEEDLYYKELQSVMNKAIENLSPRRRQVFELIKIEKRSYQQVSKMLGISESTINDHIVKANQSIRERVSRMDGIKVIILFSVADTLIH